MENIQVRLYEDYELNGVVTNFEAYMFMTKDRFIRQHENMENQMLLVIDETDVREDCGVSLDKRMAFMEAFNNAVKQVCPSFPKPNCLTCFIIDFEDLENMYYIEDLDEVYQNVKADFTNWCLETNRIGVMVQHWSQENRYPHVHILHTKKRGESDAFQQYLMHLQNKDE